MKYLTCCLCKQEKFADEFAWNNRGNATRSNHCKECHREYGRKHYQKHKERYATQANLSKQKQQKYLFKFLLQNPCIDCGETKLHLLDFDHVNGVKESSISKLMSTHTSIQSIENELQKCEVRCTSCHRTKTAKEQNWIKLQIENIMNEGKNFEEAWDSIKPNRKRDRK